MSEYATVTCPRCLRRVPGNEAYKSVKEEVSGYSKNSKDGWSKTNKRYKTKTEWICWHCKEEEKRKRNSCLITLGTIASLIIFPFVFSFRNSDYQSRSNEYSSVSPSADAGPAMDNKASTPIDPVHVQENSDAESATDPMDGNEAPTPAIEQKASVPRADDGVSAKVRDAILKALEAGNSGAWEDRGQKGYIVTSSSQDYGEKICRNVYLTIIEGQEQEKGETSTWCRNDTEGWHYDN